MTRMISSTILFLCVTGLSACGGGNGGGNTSASSANSSTISFSSSSIVSSQSTSSQISSSSSSSSTLSLEIQNQAAAETATENSNCEAIQPFYWEIGDKNSLLGSGSVGDNTYTATTVMSIASASKWVFGAYVAQLRQGELTDTDIAALTMRAGYTNFNELSCVRLLPDVQETVSVNECFEEAHSSGNNNDYDEDALNRFSYNGGHFQKLAVDLGLGNENNLGLKTAYQTQLGSDFEFTFGPPQPGGGISTSAEQYAIFLRKILNKQLWIYDLLGANSTCTNLLTCESSLYTPAPINRQFNYSIGHWVENDPVTGDGAFSSAGAFGFYPWIDATKNFYGIVARKSDAGTGFDSIECGRLIRKAWMTGQAQ